MQGTKCAVSEVPTFHIVKVFLCGPVLNTTLQSFQPYSSFFFFRAANDKIRCFDVFGQIKWLQSVSALKNG